MQKSTMWEKQCSVLYPHFPHNHQVKTILGWFLVRCAGVKEEKLRHKHTLKIHPRNKRNSKVFNMKCTDCEVVFQFRRPSVHRLVTGKTTHFNPQMVLDWFIEGKRK